MLPYSVLECVTTQYSHSVSCISVIGPSLWCVSILPFLLSLFSISHWECIICDTAASLPYSIRMWQKRGKEKRRRQLWAAETFMRHFQRQMALLSACKSFFFLLSFVAFVAVPLCSAIKYSVQQAVALYLYATIVWQATDDFFLCILMCTQTCLSAIVLLPRDRWS